MIKNGEKKGAYQLDIQACYQEFSTNPNGLTDTEAIKKRAERGENKLPETAKPRQIVKFFAQFKDTLIILLIISAGISVYLGDMRGATILGIIVIINAVIGYFQEAKAEKILESLQKMVHPNAQVKRNGEIKEIEAHELVPGDIVYIEEGQNIPADLRIIEYNNLQTNDFSLTGESNPMAKFTHAIQGDVPLGEQNNCVFRGTTVATGNGRGIVIATGANSQLGKIANLSQAQQTEISPLQKEMQNVAKKLTIGTIILCVLLVIITLSVHFTIKEAFLFAVGIAAAMVPQGLPAQINIALSLAAGRLAKKNALIKQLSCVESLGAVNIICTDKTGTLTKNEMTVKKLRLGGNIYSIEGDGYNPQGSILDAKNKVCNHKMREKFFLTCNLASNATVHAPDNEHPTRYCLGDPTEGALVSLAEKAGFSTTGTRKNYLQHHQFGFDSMRKMMSSIREYQKETEVFVKGSPQAILEHCTQRYDGNSIKILTSKQKLLIQKTIDERSGQAYRIIACACKPIKKYSPTLTMQAAESELIFLGLNAIIDPPRAEVPEAMQIAQNAKIKIIMITGDYGPTAEAIAKQIGMDHEKILTVIPSDQLKSLSDTQLGKTIKKHHSLIFSRADPEDKLRIVNLLKSQGYIIAVTGDGINDAPALKSANIGVAMGKVGTDIAKEASKIILLDDSFHTLVGAIKEGRLIYENIKKTTISCITSNGGELFAILISLVFKALQNIPIAINPVQILAIDLIGEMGPLTALTRDPAQKNLMQKGPRNAQNHIINKYVIIDLLWSGALMGGLGYLAYILYLYAHGVTPSGLDTNSLVYMSANSITYTSIMFSQYANIISRRAGFTKHFWDSYLRANKKLLRAFGLGFLAILVLVYMPVVHDYFGFGSLHAQERLFPLGAGLIFLTVREGRKVIVRRKGRVNEE